MNPNPGAAVLRCIPSFPHEKKMQAMIQLEFTENRALNGRSGVGKLGIAKMLGAQGRDLTPVSPQSSLPSCTALMAMQLRPNYEPPFLEISRRGA